MYRNRCSRWERLRLQTEHVLENHRFHIIVISLVIIDVIIVVFQLLIDHDIIRVDDGSDDHHHVKVVEPTEGSQGESHGHSKKEQVEHALHYTSLFILALFVLELIVKLLVFKLEFFKKKFEVFDGVVVLISFVLDLLPTTGHTAAELVIVARLWRVARIINGIVLSITTAKEEEISNLHRTISILQKENEQLRAENDLLKTKS